MDKTLVRKLRSPRVRKSLTKRFLLARAVAETTEQFQLLQAQRLNDGGQFAQVIRVLDPLVHGAAGALDEVTRGRAWNILGQAYEAMGDYQGARRCYEAAIQLLRTHESPLSYASALNNLGTLEIDMGEWKVAETLLRKAKGLYANAEDRTGLTEVATNLAILALNRNEMRVARGFLAEAFRDAERAKDLNDSDRAGMYSIKGALAARDRDFAAAVLDYQQSIDFRIRARGPRCYVVAVEYSLQGDAYRELGDYRKASDDIIAALVLVEQTVGRNTPLYAATELAYARLLHATGAKPEAAQKEKEAKALLESIRHRECNGCSVSAASFR
jgi:tetratricopeptide (TPR) repeat protein